jgi:hypothetical protein
LNLNDGVVAARYCYERRDRETTDLARDSIIDDTACGHHTNAHLPLTIFRPTYILYIIFKHTRRIPYIWDIRDLPSHPLLTPVTPAFP